MSEALKNSLLPQTLTEVAGDFADLLQKELRLAKVEVSEKVAIKVRAGLGMGIAGGIGIIALLLVVQAIVFAIASFGIALHWASLIVAAGLLAIAGGIYAKTRADAREEFTPERTLHQVRQDIRSAKEQLT
jgi:uncharacterized membrane protein YqjE